MLRLQVNELLKLHQAQSQRAELHWHNDPMKEMLSFYNVYICQNSYCTAQEIQQETRKFCNDMDIISS
jgi:hypothetical protein